MGGLPASQKVWTFPFCWISSPPKNWILLSPDHRTYIGKKVSLIAFRQIVSKILPKACIFSNAIMAFLKKLLGTKSLNTKQCPTGLSPKIISHYPHKHLWETLAMGTNPTQQPKIYSFPPPGKSPLINLHLLSKMSFVPLSPHQIVFFI